MICADRLRLFAHALVGLLVPSHVNFYFHLFHRDLCYVCDSCDNSTCSGYSMMLEGLDNLDGSWLISFKLTIIVPAALEISTTPLQP